MSDPNEAKATAKTVDQYRAEQRLRLTCLDLALRQGTPNHHTDVVRAAEAFEKFVIGESREVSK